MQWRTNADSFGRELSKAWCVGVAGRGRRRKWQSSADFCNTSATAEGLENEEEGSDSPNIEYNNNIYLSINDHFHKSTGSQYHDIEGVHVTPCDCDLEVVEGQKIDL